MPLLVHCIPVKSKSGADVKAALVETHAFFSSVQHPELLKMSDGRIKRIQSDRGLEFVNVLMEQFCAEKGILHTTTT
eukprot:3603645-Amphidinium_carterae.1